MPHAMRHPRARPRPRIPGLALAETVIAAALLTVGAAAALSAAGAAATTERLAERRRVAARLAADLMAEIDAAPAFTPGVTDTLPAIGPPPAPGDTRDAFARAADYAFWQATPPQTKDGTELIEYDRWTRSVVVLHADDALALTTTPTDRLIVRVTVSHNGLPVLTLTRYRARDGQAVWGFPN